MPSHHPLSSMSKNDCAFTLTKLFSERFSLGILLKPGNRLKISVKTKNCYAGGFPPESLSKCNRILNRSQFVKLTGDALEYERQRRKATAVMIIEQPWKKKTKAHQMILMLYLRRCRTISLLLWLSSKWMASALSVKFGRFFRRFAKRGV